MIKRFPTELVIGISSFFKAIPFIFRNGLGGFFLFPFVLNVLFFIGGTLFSSSVATDLIDFLSTYLEMNSWSFWGAEILSGTIGVLIWIVIKFMMFLVMAYIGGYVVLVLMSPVMAYLSERTEAILSGKQYPFSLPQLMRDMARGLIVATRNIVLELTFTIVIILIGFIPIVGFVSPFLLFFVTAYFYGFSFLDYNNERRKIPIGDSIQLMRRHRGIAIGLAAPFTFILMIPFIGTYLASLFCIIGAVGGTIAYVKIEEEKA